jgi:hypothetical protein
MTMREYDALLRRRNSHQEAEMYRAAFIVSSIYNVNRDTKYHPKPFMPEDFMAKRATDKQTPNEMLEMVKHLHAAFGGKPPEE